jgi:hypothetical protein
VEQFVSAHEKMGEAYHRGFAAFKEHGFDSAAGDKAVAGMDRAPSELLDKREIGSSRSPARPRKPPTRPPAVRS